MIAIRCRINTPFSAVRGSPATVADPEVGAIRVPRVRTVVVFPAPLGPRNPNTSPRLTSKETSSYAIRSPKCLERFWTESANSETLDSGVMPAPPTSHGPRVGQLRLGH